MVLARLSIPMPNVTTRFSLEAVPIFMAGMLFGPVAGGLVGFTADAVGCLFSGFGYNPIFCVPPILYGVFGGVFRRWLGKGVTLPRLLASMLPPVIVGSILWQSAALAFIYNSKGTFNMYGGTITGGKVDADGKGGNLAFNAGTFNLYDGTITNGTATEGYNVYLEKDVTFNQEGGSIIGNAGDETNGVFQAS